MILHTGGGGAKQLAIRVIGGTVQPTGVAGMLWVNTGVQANKWTFSVATPASPSVGDLWIKTDAANANAINILKKNAAIENVKTVYQYLSGAWTRMDAYYHNGTSWAQLSSRIFNPASDYTYTGVSQVVDDGSGHWRIKLLTSGILTLLSTPPALDVFLVGGGAGGGPGGYSGGAGAGYTTTQLNVTVAKDDSKTIVIGAGGAAATLNAGGGTTSALGYSANGGVGVNSDAGRNGGSGGGTYPNGAGGTNGGNGGNGGGTGQGTTTKEFAETSGTLYSTGGTAGPVEYTDKLPNTGDGGSHKRAGGSGIVVIRDHR